MSGNRFGVLFQYQTFGESHGSSIGCIVDGVPPLIGLSEEDIQVYLDKRRPGQSRYTTQRNEKDQVKILSGVMEGMTTGTPIGLLIENTDTKSKDYSEIKNLFRPGHADYTYQKKYGIRDYRGGGRSSARETAMRVAAGAVARMVIKAQMGERVTIRAAVTQIGSVRINHENWDWNEVDNNPFFTPDKECVAKFEEVINDARKSLSSIGAVVELHIDGVPAGLGCPVYDKLDSDLAKGLMSINAAKGVEIGAGFESVSLSGQENCDEIVIDEVTGKPVFLSNSAGGILGGISTGQTIVARVAFKPTPSIPDALRTIDVDGNATTIVTKGRHDPCVGIRGVPVVEAMGACVIADHWLRFKAQCL